MHRISFDLLSVLNQFFFSHPHCSTQQKPLYSPELSRSCSGLMSNLVKLLQAHVFRIIFYQLMIIMGFILIMLWLKGWQGALSAFAGAMSYALPTFLFLGLLSRFGGARAASRFMIAFFLGEAVKLIACGVLFLAFVQVFHMDLISTFLGLSVAIVAFWIASPAALFKGSAK